VIRSLSRDGPGRALLTAAAASGSAVAHSVVSLEAADQLMVDQARRKGLEVRCQPEGPALRTLIAQADIVQVHFWNNPRIYRLLGDDLPPMRLLLWSHVSGAFAPQVLPPELLGHADMALASCVHTTTLPGLSHLEYIPAVAGWERFGHIEPVGDHPFTIGYLGKLDFSRLHPEFISICAGIRVPDARFIVCGTGGALPTLRRQAKEAGIEQRMEFRGFVENIGEAIAEMDVFGYPLAEHSYAASELALQEAMYGGVPPVVLGPTAVRRLVAHDETGLIAETARDYALAIAYLHDHPSERTRMGRAAHEHAARTWSPESIAESWPRAYERLLRVPKRARSPYLLAEQGALRFIDGLCDAAAPFLASLSGSDERALLADREISRSPGVLCTGDGGILDYRDAYPDDPHLRLWAGLIIYRQSRPAVAAGEFAAAIRLGLDHWRPHWYLGAAARAAGAPLAVDPAPPSVPSALRGLAEEVLG
jgi:glycosyltransferase involved in cell wall biosynthesis